MKISVILDNFNYDKYIGSAIESVLAQTYKDFELIVVDDGSIDESRKIISEFAAKDNRIKVILKDNGGQASTFNVGFKEATGDIICFLDSDDIFLPTKLYEIAALHSDGYDYIYTDHQAIDDNGLPINDNLKRYKYDGQNLFLVYYISKYPGNVTSTLSLSRRLAEEIFPLPDESGWRIQADDCIVFQASMRSRAKFLDKKLTHYRVHIQNGHYGKKRSFDYIYLLLKKRNKLKQISLERSGCPDIFLKNGYNIVAEFKTHKIIDKTLLFLYLRVLFYEMNLPIFKKIECTIDIYNYYKSQKT